MSSHEVGCWCWSDPGRCAVHNPPKVAMSVAFEQKHIALATDEVLSRALAAICHAAEADGRSCREKYGVGSWCSACLQHELADALRAARAGAETLRASRGEARVPPEQAEKNDDDALDKIPVTLWLDVKAKAKRDGISIRGLILKLLKEWLDT